VFSPDLALTPTMTEPPQKWGVHRLRIDWGILDEMRIQKHDTQAYKTKFTWWLSYYNLGLNLQKGKQKVLQKIEHVFSRNNSLNVQDTHLALKVNTFIGKL
jgi:hypothetical protein